VQGIELPLTIFQVLEKNLFNTGSVHQMFQAASGLAERGHRTFVVSRPDRTLEERCRDAGVGFLPLALRNELDIRSMVHFSRLVREFHPDVIHVHKGIAHAVALGGTLRHRAAAFVVNRGVSFPLDMLNRAKYRTRRVDRIVTVCQQIKDVVVSSGGISPERVEVVYAGVDITLFDAARWNRDDFRSEKQIPADLFLFAQVGVRDWKGWRELIDAFAVVRRTYANARLALIAVKNQDQGRQIGMHAAAAGVAEDVYQIEYRSDMARVLSAADCVVDASWAGTGVTGTIREAMALAKPVIATDCGGNRELVSSPEVGWLVPPKNHERLVAAMEQVIESREKSQQVGHAAMNHVRNGFSRERRITHLEQLYREIVSRNGEWRMKNGE